MSELEKDGPVQSPNNQVEGDEISNDELDAVAGGVLALQRTQGGEQSAEDGGLSSLLSVGCICLAEA